MARVALLSLLVLAWPALAHGQSASDCTGLPTGTVTGTGPTPRIEFNKSADHDLIVSGITVLTSYAVAVCQGTALRSQANLGKPTPDAAGKIVAPVPITTLAKNVTYYVVVYAIGPGGSNNTGPLTPFVPAGPPAVDGSGARILP
jgi:hypothetical protein